MLILGFIFERRTCNCRLVCAWKRGQVRKEEGEEKGEYSVGAEVDVWTKTVLVDGIAVDT